MMFVALALTGCSTFSVNLVKYYNETVATVGEKNISRYELITAYNNYGKQYYTNNNQSTEDALYSTLDLLIQRETLYQYALSNSKYTLSAYDINEMYQSVVDSFDNMMSNYITSAKKMLNMDTETSSSEENKETVYKLEDYEYNKRAEVVFDTESNSYKIKYIIPAENIENYTINADFVDNFNSKTDKEIINKLIDVCFNKFYNDYKYEENCEVLENKAKDLLVKYLMDYEYYLRDSKGNKFPNDYDSLIYRFFERLYNDQKISAYITKVQQVYLKTEDLNTTSLISCLVDNIENDHDKYLNSLSTMYNNLIGDTKVYYMPNTEDAKFGYFLHVLIPFNEDEGNNTKTKLENLENHKNSYSEEAYQAEYDKIIFDITRTKRDVNTGKEIEDSTDTLETILENYKNVSSVEDFIKFMFEYTSDTATLTADMPYVIGYNLNTEDKYSKMVDEFTDEAIRLMKEASNRGLDSLKTEYNEYIVTTYGVHLLYYVGDVENPVNYEDRNKLTISTENSEYNLCKIMVNELTNKSYFDLMFDTVYPAGDSGVYTSKTGYSAYETKLVENSNIKITKYDTRIKGSTKV